MAELIGEIFWEALRVIAKAIGVVFIKVFTFSTTPIKEIYLDESKDIVAYIIGALFFLALISILIYYTNS